MAKFKIGETVYIKVDAEKVPLIVTGILKRRRFVQYEVSGTETFYFKQEFELERSKEHKEVKGFKTDKK